MSICKDCILYKVCGSSHKTEPCNKKQTITEWIETRTRKPEQPKDGDKIQTLFCGTMTYINPERYYEDASITYEESTYTEYGWLDIVYDIHLNKYLTNIC